MSRYAYTLAVLLFTSLSYAHAQTSVTPDCPEGKCPAAKTDKPSKQAKQPKYSGPQAESCEQKAVSKKSGKKLSGAAKNKFMDKCMSTPA